MRRVSRAAPATYTPGATPASASGDSGREAHGERHDGGQRDGSREDCAWRRRGERALRHAQRPHGGEREPHERGEREGDQDDEQCV